MRTWERTYGLLVTELYGPLAVGGRTMNATPPGGNEWVMVTPRGLLIPLLLQRVTRRTRLETSGTQGNHGNPLIFMRNPYKSFNVKICDLHFERSGRFRSRFL